MTLTKLVTALTCAALVLGACGGDGDGDQGSTANTPSATSTAASTEQSSASATVHAATPTAEVTTTATGAATTATSALSTATGVAATAVPPTRVVTAPAATVAPTSAPAPGGAVTLTVRARDKTFDIALLRVRTGAQVTAVLVNEDAGEEHNLSFAIRGLGHDTCAGPCSTTQTFTAPEPGSYFFACTVHDFMFGTLIVDP